MKSFRVYLPGGREISGAGMVVVVIAALAMGGCAFYLDEIARMIPGLTILAAKYLLIAVGLLVVACGWLGLRLGGLSFAKKEPASEQPAPTRGNGT